VAVAELPVFFNARAGKGVDEAALAAACALHGLTIVPVALTGENADAQIDAWRERAPALWIAAGGDGTVGSVARAARASGGTLGVLPLGTRNHFARDLGLPLELEDAAKVLAHGVDRQVDVAELDGRMFLNNASLGLYNQFVLCREHERRRPHMALWPALCKATWQALRAARDLSVALEVDGERVRRRTPVLLVGNNEYVLQGLQRGRRERLDGGVLSVVVLRPRSRAGLVWLGLRALVGAVSAERDFEEMLAAELEVESAQSQLEVALDGEPGSRPTPLRFRTQPGALRVRAPRPEPEQA
jgi:diacylglycerol kinase family enzyme